MVQISWLYPCPWTGEPPPPFWGRTSGTTRQGGHPPIPFSSPYAGLVRSSMISKSRTGNRGRHCLLISMGGCPVNSLRKKLRANCVNLMTYFMSPFSSGTLSTNMGTMRKDETKFNERFSVWFPSKLLAWTKEFDRREVDEIECYAGWTKIFKKSSHNHTKLFCGKTKYKKHYFFSCYYFFWPKYFFTLLFWYFPQHILIFLPSVGVILYCSPKSHLRFP